MSLIYFVDFSIEDRNKTKKPDSKILMDEIIPLEQEYESTFCIHPPTFGYPDDELLDALRKALDTKTPMRGYDETINEESGITDEDIKAGRGVIT